MVRNFECETWVSGNMVHVYKSIRIDRLVYRLLSIYVGLYVHIMYMQWSRQCRIRVSRATSKKRTATREKKKEKKSEFGYAMLGNENNIVQRIT